MAGWAGFRHAAVFEAFIVSVVADHDFAVPRIKHHRLRKSGEYAVFSFAPRDKIEFYFSHFSHYVSRRRRKNEFGSMSLYQSHGFGKVTVNKILAFGDRFHRERLEVEAFNGEALRVNVNNYKATFTLPQIFDGIAPIFSASDDYVQCFPFSRWLVHPARDIVKAYRKSPSRIKSNSNC